MKMRLYCSALKSHNHGPLKRGPRALFYTHLPFLQRVTSVRSLDAHVPLSVSTSHWRHVVVFYLELVFSVGLTLGVIGPDSIALWVVKPLSIRVTHFDYFLCLKKIKNLIRALNRGI